MKHQANKTIYIILFFIGIFITSCSKKAENNIRGKNCRNINVTLFNFIKSVTTVDTLLFYTTVNADSIITALNQMQESNTSRHINVSNRDLHKMFFFNYGPWKILPQNLKILREKEFPIKSYSVEIKEQERDYCKANLCWTRTPESDTSKISVKLRRINSVWQITSTIFEMDK